jgi:FeS assembly SUF system protein
MSSFREGEDVNLVKHEDMKHEEGSTAGDAARQERTHLPVLPHSGKVEQLKQEVAAERVEADAPAPQSALPQGALEEKLLEGRIIAALKTVYDPEIPVDIYELGLIYKIEIDAERAVTIRMTLTAPACPVAGTLPGEVERKVEEVEGVKSAKVDLVWDPPWSREMMSESAMLALGMF